MESTYIWIIIIVIVIIINSMINKKITDNNINKNNKDNVRLNDYPYKSKMLLTKTEYNFYMKLKINCLK